MESFEHDPFADEMARLGPAEPGHSAERDSHQETGPSWSNPDISFLGTGRRPPPTFPYRVLGTFWADWAERRAKGASAAPDYVACSLLTVTAALLANVRWPMAGAEWTEPPLLWVGLVGSPSSGKSPAMDAAFGPLARVEDHMAVDFDMQQRVYESKREEAEAQREAWKADVKEAVKGERQAPLMPDSAVAPTPPVRPRVRVADATAEKLAALAAALPRGLLLVRDELAGWLGAFDKYGGGGSDRAFALEMYGGRSYTIDRMRTSEPVKIRHLSIGVLGGIQPDKLCGVLSGPDDGLSARFLWCWPEAMSRFSLAREIARDDDALSAFERLSALALGSDSFGNPEPIVIRMEPTAENVLEEFAREMAERAHETTGALSGTIGKARGHALRLSCVLEFLWWSGQPGEPEPGAISEQAMIGACALVEAYFVPMAERVYGDAAIPAEERQATTLARHLKRMRLPSFNARDLRRQLGGALRKAAAMDEACAALSEAYLIREAPTRVGTAPGRAAKNYDVNPIVFGGEHD